MSQKPQLRPHEAGGFTCINCKLQVPGEVWGTRHRNHCPSCLYSRHLDDQPGDRASPCRAAMMPIGIEVRDGERAHQHSGEWALIHRCTRCGVLKSNRIAGDDSERALLAMVLRPLTKPAFPLDDLR